MYGYLIHHGIKGQKWGIRRFQNSNGTLTAEGRTRYKISSNKKAFNEYAENAQKLWKKRSEEYNKNDDEKIAYETKEFNKHGYKDWEDAYDKARKQNPDIDSGKLKYADSIWNIINTIEDQSDDIFRQKENKIGEKYSKKFIENGEAFVDKIFKGTDIKYKDITKLGKKTYNYEHQSWYDNEWAENLFDILWSDNTKKYRADVNDEGDFVIKKK